MIRIGALREERERLHLLQFLTDFLIELLVEDLRELEMIDLSDSSSKYLIV